MRHPLLEQAITAQQNAEMGKSKDLLMRYLEVEPEDAQAIYMLGMICNQQQAYKESIKYINKAILFNPQSAQYLLGLGLSYDQDGQLELAEKAYRKAESMRPDIFQVHYDIGCFLQGHDRFEEAVSYFNKTLAINPNHFPAYSNLANALQKTGALEQAESYSRKVNKLLPNNVQLMKNLAQLLIQQEKYHQAVELLERTISLDSKYLPALIMFGQLNYLLGNKNKAEAVVKKVLSLEPKNIEAQSMLAKCHIDNEEFAQAFILLEETLSSSPTHLASILSMAELKAASGNIAESVEIYLNGIAKFPNSVELIYGLGVVYSYQGKFENAIRYFLEALKIKKSYTQALHAITKITNYNDLNNDEAKIAIQLNEEIKSNSKSLTTTQKIDLYFSLGKIYDDIKEFDLSFEFYQLANNLRYAINSYNIAEFSEFNKVIFETFSKDKTIQKSSDSKPQPIFIVGMPRSGTTLLEQILSKHEQIFGAGELIEIQKIAAQIDQYPNFNKLLEKEDLQKLNSQYISKLVSIKGVGLKQWVIDKNPINFRHVGLIKTILPDAKIIHMQRHPLDTILSIYFQKLATGHKYAFNLDALSQYYIKYQELMVFWQEQFGDDIIICRYDELVAETKTTVSTILNRIGLDWQQNCEDFQQNKRNVNTASAWQVRQPIHQDSVERWLRYKPHLVSIEKTMEQSIQDWNKGKK
jgi:tetratricopeptide (TPR) repeat protein